MASKKAPKVKDTPGFSARVDTTIKKALAKKFEDGSVEALLTTKLNKEQLPRIQAASEEALKELARAIRGVLATGFDPADDSSPSITFSTVDGTVTTTPAGMGKAWPDLAQSTLVRKMNKRSAKNPGKWVARYQYRIWADRAKQNDRIFAALKNALSDLAYTKPTIEKVFPKGKTIAVGGTTKLTLQYAIAFRRLSRDGGDALTKIVLRNFVSGAWRPLRKGEEPSGGWKGKSPASPEHVLYPEHARPLLGPIAAISGRHYRAQLRRLLK